MFTKVTLAIGYYNRHIHSGDGDTTHKNTIKLFKKKLFSLYSLTNSFLKRTKVCFEEEYKGAHNKKSVKEGIYRIQILCRCHPFSY